MEGKFEQEDKSSVSSNEGPAHQTEPTTQKKRRAKGDSGERNFTCGCGKSYLSYPALYTHIKTKHDGVAPTGTSQPQTNGKSGRGRPKKEDAGQRVKDDDKNDVHFDGSDANVATETVLNYLKSIINELRSDDHESNRELILSSSIDTFDLILEFPKDLLKPLDYEPVLRELTQIYKAKQIGIEEIDRETDLKKTLMNKIFAIFIFMIGRHLTREFYREFVFFLMMYRKALNELGWKKKNESMGIDERSSSQEFCGSNNGEYGPDISNDFITDKWPIYFSQYNTQKFKILGTTGDGIKVTVFLTQHFCNWLNALRYTNSRLAINESEN